MKRLLTIMLLTVAAIMPLRAQNANRNGFFVELGAGMLNGSTPRVAVELTQNHELYAYFAKGVAADLYLGGRFRIANNWAYEFKFGTSTPLKNFNALTLRGLPVGFRYISSELFSNVSLYANLDLGVAMCPKGYVREELQPGIKQATYFRWELPSNNDCFFPSLMFNLGVGLNITNNLYAGISYEGTATKGWRLKPNDEWYFYGNAGIKIGYRF